MKTLSKLSLLICFSIGFMAQGQNNGYDDDIYYSSKDAKALAASRQQMNSSSSQQLNSSPAQETQNNSSGTEQKQSDNSEYNNSNPSSNNNSNYNNNAFSYDDYYDYAYASRLRRFYNPCYNMGYYDNFYTNSYWYDYNPYHYGVSIYMGYNWWGSNYYAYSYFPNYGWGGYYGNMSYYSNSFCYGGYNYMNGYNHGFNDAYYGYGNGLNNYYYNSYDNNSHHYYGPRKSISSNGRVATSASSFTKKYEDAINVSNNGTFNNLEQSRRNNVTQNPSLESRNNIAMPAVLPKQNKGIEEVNRGYFSNSNRSPQINEQNNKASFEIRNNNSLPPNNNSLSPNYEKSRNNMNPGNNSGREVEFNNRDLSNPGSPEINRSEKNKRSENFNRNEIYGNPNEVRPEHNNNAIPDNRTNEVKPLENRPNRNYNEMQRNTAPRAPRNDNSYSSPSMHESNRNSNSQPSFGGNNSAPSRPSFGGGGGNGGGRGSSSNSGGGRRR